MNQPPIIEALEKVWSIELLPADLSAVVVAEDLLAVFPPAQRAMYYEAKAVGKGAYYLEEGAVVSLNLTELTLTELHIPASLTSLRYLDVSDCKDLTTLTFAEALPQLERLDVSDSGLATIELPAGFIALKQLDLSRNQLTKVTLHGSFPKLQTLDLSRNQLKNFPPTWVEKISKLPALETLYLRGNPINISVLTYYDEKGNYLSAFQQLAAAFAKSEIVENREYKILVVGDGKVGKSCFVERLINNKYIEDWDSTHGIAIRQFTNQEGRFSFDYVLNIWDFGGQDIYHDTHRLFMQRNTIYLLLWNQNSEIPNSKVVQKIGWRTYKWDNKGLRYWLRYIAHIGGTTPVIIAQTNSARSLKKPDHSEKYTIKEAYKEQFYPLEFVHIDSKPDDIRENGYRHLLRKVEDAIEEGLNRQEYLPKHWIAIKKALKPTLEEQPVHSKEAFLQKENKTISLEDYLAIAKKYGEAAGAMDLLENWLVKTGYVFYREGLFNNEIILDQEWVIRAVYTIFERAKSYGVIKENGGRFSGADLAEHWDNYSAAEQQLFLSFMLGCEMCFEIGKSWERTFKERQFIAIELLPEAAPAGFASLQKTWSSKDFNDTLLHVKYHYSFLQYGIIQRFIARTHNFAAIENIYKYGVIIEDKEMEGRAIIQASTDKDEIIIYIPAKKKRLLEKIRNEFKEIHQEKIKEYGSLEGQLWVDLNKLKEKTGVTEIETVNGTTVNVEDYKVFLPSMEKEVFVKPKLFYETLIQEKIKTATPMNALQKNVYDLVANNHLQQAIEAIIAAGNPSKNKQAIALKRQLSQLRNDRISGTLSHNEETSSNNKIARGILELVDHTSEPAEEVLNPKKEETLVNNSTTKMTILFAAANPSEEARIATGVEYRTIRQEIAQGNRDNFEILDPQFAVKISDLIRALKAKPTILHFAGHGIESGIVLTDRNNQSEPLNPVVMRRLFKPLIGHTKLVILNSCLSAEQAKMISKMGDIVVIGNQTRILDEAALRFARGFYTELSEGGTYEEAFNSGCTDMLTKFPEYEGLSEAYIDGKLQDW